MWSGPRSIRRLAPILSWRNNHAVEQIDLLPVVKAYPALSRTYGEVSCIAGVQTTPDGPRWLRLYPVPFRALDDRQRFAKYQPMSLRAEAHSGDRRPETRRPDRDSIRPTGPVLPTTNGWEARRSFIEPLMVNSMCDVFRSQRADGTSLAVFRPKEVLDVVIERRDINADKADAARAWAAQPSLLDEVGAEEQSHQLAALEQIPWTFKYRYRCDDRGCRGHLQTIIDWEIVELYRNVREHDDWQDRLRAKWLDQMCGAGRDTAFFVGNQHLHPTAFLVLGVWWPPRQNQLSLGV
jgi:hypothetical protein